MGRATMRVHYLFVLGKIAVLARSIGVGALLSVIRDASVRLSFYFFIKVGRPPLKIH